MPTHHDLVSFSLENIRKQFCAMSDDYKRAVMKTMSTQLLLLSCVAIYLPPELVKNICLSMMDGKVASDLTQEKIDMLREKIDMAAEVFYTMSIGQAFDLYYGIKIKLKDKTKPIGLLYIASESERNVVLGLKSSWYYAQPVINFNDKEKIDLLSDDLKQTYLQGQEIFVLPDDAHNAWAPTTLGRNILIGTGAGVGTLGVMSALGALIAVSCGCPVSSILCNPGFLGANLSITGLFALATPFCGLHDDECCGVCRHSHHMTL